MINYKTLDWDTKIKEDFLNYFNIPEYISLSRDELIVNYFNEMNKLIKQNTTTVKISDEIKQNQYYIENIEIIEKIKKNFEEGDNLELNRRLSKKSIVAHDQDLLLNNWGIHHFHLGDNIQNNFYQRTNELLFVKIENDSVYFLEIKEHNNFSSIDFLKIIHNNWSNIIENYMIKDMIDIQPKPNETEIMELWKNGIQIAVTFIDNNYNEVSYLPINGGTNINNQSLSTIFLLTKINRDCYNIEYFIKQHKEEIQNFINENQKNHVHYTSFDFYLRFNSQNNNFYLSENISGLNFSWNEKELVLMEE